MSGAQTQLSADGGWWWNGADWVPAESADGLWRWDGQSWQPAVQASEEDPAALADALDRLADDRFAEGGHMLALRAHEWRPRNGELTDLVAQAAPLAARLADVDARLAGGDHAGRPLLRTLLAGGDRAHLDTEARRIEEELRPLAALIGRTAPQPSLKEADGILVPARRLHERVLELRQALVRHQELEAAQARRTGAARAELEEAAAAREVALSAHAARVRDREAEHARAVSELEAALRRLRLPGPGATLAAHGGLTLHENRVDTPDGRGPVDGARARLGTAQELAAAEPEAIDGLFLLDSAHAGRLHEAASGGSEDRFVLVCTSRVNSAVPVPHGAEAEAAAFVAALEEAASSGRKRRAAWRAEVSAARASLEAALGDTALVDEARAELERAREDPDLAAPVRAAEARLREAEEPPQELIEARSRVRDLVERLLERPADLQPAATE